MDASSSPVYRRGASAFRRPGANSFSLGQQEGSPATGVPLQQSSSGGSTPRASLKMHTSHIGLGLPVPPLKVSHFQGSPRVSPRGGDHGVLTLASPKLGHIPSSPLRQRPYVTPLPPRAPSPLQPSVFRVSTPSCSPRPSSTVTLLRPVDGSQSSLSASSSSTSMSSESSAASSHTSSTERLLLPEAFGVQLPRSILKTGS